LREIYSARPERILYLFPEKNAPLQRITDVVNVVQHLQEENASEPKVPKELQAQRVPNYLNIQVRLVTSRATNVPCPKGSFN
jgi:hypothetical protein